MNYPKPSAIDPAATETTGAQTTSGIAPRVLSGLVAVMGLGAVIWLLVRSAPTTLCLLVEQHAPAMIGLPLAAGVATVLVAGLRALEGELGLEFLGLKATGAGAALISWILTFSVAVLAIRALW